MEVLEYMHKKVSELKEANETEGTEFPYSGDAPLRMKYNLRQCRITKGKD